MAVLPVAQGEQNILPPPILAPLPPALLPPPPKKISEVTRVNEFFKKIRIYAKFYIPFTYLAYRSVFFNNDTSFFNCLSKFAEIAVYFVFLKALFGVSLLCPAMVPFAAAILAAPLILDGIRLIVLTVSNRMIDLKKSVTECLKAFEEKIEDTRPMKEKQDLHLVYRIHNAFRRFRNFLKKRDEETAKHRKHDFLFTCITCKELFPGNGFDLFDIISKYAKITALFYVIVNFISFYFPYAQLLTICVLAIPVIIDAVRISGIFDFFLPKVVKPEDVVQPGVIQAEVVQPVLAQPDLVQPGSLQPTLVNSEVKQVNKWFQKIRIHAKSYVPITYLVYRSFFPNNKTGPFHYLSKFADIAVYFCCLKYFFGVYLMSPIVIPLAAAILAIPLVIDIGRLIVLKISNKPIGVFDASGSLENKRKLSKKDHPHLVCKIHQIFRSFRRFLRNHDWVFTYKTYRAFLPDNDLDLLDIPRYAKIATIFWAIEEFISFYFPYARFLAIGLLALPLLIDAVRVSGIFDSKKGAKKLIPLQA